MSRLPFVFFAGRVLLALLVVALATVFATKSPAVDTTAARAPVGAEAPVALAPVGPAAPASPTPVVRRGTPLDFLICTTNSSWTRPRAQIEAEYLATPASPPTFEDIAAQFRAPFWRDAGNEGS